MAVGFPRQEYWSGLSCPPPGDLPNPGTELTSPGSSPLAGGFPTIVSPGKSQGTNNSSQVIMWTHCVTSVSTSYNSPHLFPPSHMASLRSLHTRGHSLLRAYVLVLLPRVPPPDIYLACSLTSFKYLLKCHFLSEGNGKPLQYSCLENPINSMKRQKDRTLKDGNSPGR